MPDFLIRPFAWGDVPAVTAIYRHYVENSTATFDTVVPSEAAMATHKFAPMVDAGHPLLVAEREGQVLAYAYASVYRPRPAYRFTCEDTIYCAPEAQGQGVGTALLQEVIETARRFGFKQMIGVITAESKGSIRLHEKLGFRVVGTYQSVGFKFDRWLDIVHMQKGL
ncbi:MAG TPA: GNAT family N-acetyltransferase [Devosiaceae bacterium]|jgi:phosphinothricin acetyltransferase|nr:GNAT family N-acetyltransferase [Devosiaceae bacterium]